MQKEKLLRSRILALRGLLRTCVTDSFFSDIASENFKIELQNQSLGVVVGQGIINTKLIGWEFRLEQFGFEGFEFYEASKEGGAYLFHAEYATSDDFRTVIHGKIWREK